MLRSVVLVILWACIYIHACIRMYMHAYVHTYVHTYVFTYIHTYIHTHISFAGARSHRQSTRAYICTYVHTYIRMYLHTYIHTFYLQGREVTDRVLEHIDVSDVCYRNQCIHTYVCVQMYVCIHVCLHARMQTHV